ncbi:hypothetical protein EV175_007259, partial [Coemansia sp. RSA 1933]
MGRVLPRSFSPEARRATTPALQRSPDGTQPETTRLASHLNYTPSRRPQPLRESEEEQEEETEEQLLLANYQRHAVEAQSTFSPDQCTDYTQTPMLNFAGILDRGIQDYVHPGL